jgi:hypothetical protein
MWELADPDRFIEVVQYADQQVHDRDQARVANDAEMQAYLRRWRALLAEAPQVQTYRVDTLHD